MIGHFQPHTVYYTVVNKTKFVISAFLIKKKCWGILLQSYFRSVSNVWKASSFFFFFLIFEKWEFNKNIGDVKPFFTVSIYRIFIIFEIQEIFMFYMWNIYNGGGKYIYKLETWSTKRKRKRGLFFNWEQYNVYSGMRLRLAIFIL